MKQLNWYQIFGNTHTIPDGRTVTPTDDIQTLLHCANIWDKSYTTIGEVIADDDTLFLTLIDNNAIDYLVRSTTFASSIVASESAMQYIGASDYASETLLSDSTWLTAIDGSAYKDYVIIASVPTMTSNTTPRGRCFGSTIYSSTYDYWKAFDNNSGSRWATAAYQVTNQYIGYEFATPTEAYKCIFSPLYSSAKQTVKNYRIETSDDGITWTSVASDTLPNSDVGTVSIKLNSVAAKKYIRFFIVDSYGTDGISIMDIQFYGRETGGVQSWLKAGGVNKKYTTVSEVLSDLTTLATLMSSSDAIDYLVTAKGWATEICSDSNAMADIGMNNYAANTLLADETWCKAIANSTYKTSVFNVTNPNMTDNTHPYGECISSGANGVDYNYKAFDGNANTLFDSSDVSSGSGTYLGYTFPSKAKIYLAECIHGVNTDQSTTVNLKYQSKTSDGDWTDVSDNFNVAVNNNHPSTSIIINGGANDVSYRLYKNSANRSTRLRVFELQFYGRKDI